MICAVLKSALYLQLDEPDCCSLYSYSSYSYHASSSFMRLSYYASHHMLVSRKLVYTSTNFMSLLAGTKTFRRHSSRPGFLTLAILRCTRFNFERVGNWTETHMYLTVEKSYFRQHFQSNDFFLILKTTYTCYFLIRLYSKNWIGKNMKSILYISVYFPEKYKIKLSLPILFLNQTALAKREGKN